MKSVILSALVGMLLASTSQAYEVKTREEGQKGEAYAKALVDQAKEEMDKAHALATDKTAVKNVADSLQKYHDSSKINEELKADLKATILALTNLKDNSVASSVLVAMKGALADLSNADSSKADNALSVLKNAKLGLTLALGDGVSSTELTGKAKIFVDILGRISKSAREQGSKWQKSSVDKMNQFLDASATNFDKAGYDALNAILDAADVSKGGVQIDLEKLVDCVA